MDITTKKQTMTTIAKAVLATGGDQLAIREAQLAFLQTKKDSESTRINIEAWTRMVDYLKENR